MFEDSRRFEPSEASQPDNSGLTLAPMIDVVFLLLIFFMVSTTFVTRPGLKLDLPESRSTTETATERWVISIDKTGQLYLNEEEIRLESLSTELQSNPKPVLVRADETVSHGIVVTILDSVKSAGIDSVNLSTEPENPVGDDVSE